VPKCAQNVPTRVHQSGCTQLDRLRLGSRIEQPSIHKTDRRKQPRPPPIPTQPSIPSVVGAPRCADQRRWRRNSNRCLGTHRPNHPSREAGVRYLGSQTLWWMIALPARLQNSRHNGGRAFLIFVADPITVRLCWIARRVNLAGAPLRRASQRAPGRTEIPRAAAVLARGEADGGPTHALRCAPSGGSSGRRKGCHFVKSGKSGLSRRSASESFEFRCPDRAVHRVVAGR
jgi:hypothetical protein